MRSDRFKNDWQPSETNADQQISKTKEDDVLSPDCLKYFEKECGESAKSFCVSKIPKSLLAHPKLKTRKAKMEKVSFVIFDDSPIIYSKKASICKPTFLINGWHEWCDKYMQTKEQQPVSKGTTKFQKSTFGKIVSKSSPVWDTANVNSKFIPKSKKPKKKIKIAPTFPMTRTISTAFTTLISNHRLRMHFNNALKRRSRSSSHNSIKISKDRSSDDSNICLSPVPQSCENDSDCDSVFGNVPYYDEKDSPDSPLETCRNEDPIRIVSSAHNQQVLQQLNTSSSDHLGNDVSGSGIVINDGVEDYWCDCSNESISTLSCNTNEADSPAHININESTDETTIANTSMQQLGDKLSNKCIGISDDSNVIESNNPTIEDQCEDFLRLHLFDENACIDSDIFENHQIIENYSEIFDDVDLSNKDVTVKDLVGDVFNNCEDATIGSMDSNLNVNLINGCGSNEQNKLVTFKVPTTATDINCQRLQHSQQNDVDDKISKVDIQTNSSQLNRNSRNEEVTQYTKRENRVLQTLLEFEDNNNEKLVDRHKRTETKDNMVNMNKVDAFDCLLNYENPFLDDFEAIILQQQQPHEGFDDLHTAIEHFVSKEKVSNKDNVDMPVHVLDFEHPFLNDPKTLIQQQQQPQEELNKSNTAIEHGGMKEKVEIKNNDVLSNYILNYEDPFLDNSDPFIQQMQQTNDPDDIFATSERAVTKDQIINDNKVFTSDPVLDYKDPFLNDPKILTQQQQQPHEAFVNSHTANERTVTKENLVNINKVVLSTGVLDYEHLNDSKTLTQQQQKPYEKFGGGNIIKRAVTKDEIINKKKVVASNRVLGSKYQFFNDAKTLIQQQQPDEAFIDSNTAIKSAVINNKIINKNKFVLPSRVLNIKDPFLNDPKMLTQHKQNLSEKIDHGYVVFEELITEDETRNKKRLDASNRVLDYEDPFPNDPKSLTQYKRKPSEKIVRGHVVFEELITEDETKNKNKVVASNRVLNIKDPSLNDPKTLTQHKRKPSEKIDRGYVVFEELITEDETKNKNKVVASNRVLNIKNPSPKDPKTLTQHKRKPSKKVDRGYVVFEELITEDETRNKKKVVASNRVLDYEDPFLNDPKTLTQHKRKPSKKTNHGYVVFEQKITKDEIKNKKNVDASNRVLNIKDPLLNYPNILTQQQQEKSGKINGGKVDGKEDKKLEKNSSTNENDIYDSSSLMKDIFMPEKKIDQSHFKKFSNNSTENSKHTVSDLYNSRLSMATTMNSLHVSNNNSLNNLDRTTCSSDNAIAVHTCTDPQKVKSPPCSGLKSLVSTSFVWPSTLNVASTSTTSPDQTNKASTSTASPMNLETSSSVCHNSMIIDLTLTDSLDSEDFSSNFSKSFCDVDFDSIPTDNSPSMHSTCSFAANRNSVNTTVTNSTTDNADDVFIDPIEFEHAMLSMKKTTFKSIFKRYYNSEEEERRLEPDEGNSGQCFNSHSQVSLKSNVHQKNPHDPNSNSHDSSTDQNHSNSDVNQHPNTLIQPSTSKKKRQQCNLRPNKRHKKEN